MTARRDPAARWIAASLWTAGACAPLPPGSDATDGASETAGTTTATITTGAPSSVTVDVDPTVTPECVDSSDCGSYDGCRYCDGGVCRDAPACCGAVPDGRGGLELRCTPPPGCYFDDDECGPEQLCEDYDCREIARIPACERQPLVLSAIPLSTEPRALALADLDLDQRPDLIVAVDGAVEVTRGDGLGGFMPATTTATQLAGDDLHLAVSDLDLDGDPDLAVLRFDEVGELALLFGQDAMFAAPQVMPMGQYPRRLFAGRFDGDEHPDLLVLDGSNANHITLRAGDGLGGFGPEQVDIELEANPAADVGDLDGDGVDELVATIVGDASLRQFDRSPRGFSEQRVHDARGTTAYNAVRIGDVIGDPAPDIVATRTVGSLGVVSVWRTADPEFTHPHEVGLPGGMIAVALADIDGDARRDLLALRDSDVELRVVYAGRDGFDCWQAVVLAHATAPALIAAADLDGDGRADLVVGDLAGAGATILRSGP